MIPLAVGGDHSITYSIPKAIGRDRPVGMVARAREVVGDGPVYVTFDVDGVDPGFAPGTGTPDAGGLTPREVLDILRGLAGLSVICGDVVEVAPQYDATTNTAHIAAQGLFTLLCLVALDPKRQRKPATLAQML